MGRVILNRSVKTADAAAGPAIEGPVPSILLDLVAVLIFVGVGRVSHDEPLSPGGLWSTAWPFLIGLAGGYVGILLTRWPASSLRGGAVAAGKTVILGLIVRGAIQHDDVPPAFVIVTAVIITALMLGWRLARQRIARRA